MHTLSHDVGHLHLDRHYRGASTRADQEEIASCNFELLSDDLARGGGGGSIAPGDTRKELIPPIGGPGTVRISVSFMAKVEKLLSLSETVVVLYSGSRFQLTNFC